MNILPFLLAALINPPPPPVLWSIAADRPSHLVSPDLYGIFFEEINCAGDGGIYAELIRNRGFEDSEALVDWKIEAGSAQIDRSEPLSLASPQNLRISAGKTTMSNGGYWGIGVVQGETYQFAMQKAGQAGTLRLALLGSDGSQIGESTVAIPNGGWREISTTVRATRTDPKSRLSLSFTMNGEAKIDMVSLFPGKTWKKRTNGLRSDLVQLLDDMKPAFMRFPGGCWVEGETMGLSLRWKQTVGPLSERRTQPNIWRYKSTNGLGYHEYLQLCEDLNTQAMFVINCGMSHREVVPMNQMDEFVQDAIDSVEYAMGPVTSKWGALRAKNGHPAPFPLKYLQIGNENGGPNYEERYGLMYRALKAKYPKLQLIANLWGGYPKKTPIDILDEHYYSNPDFFVANANRYDTYDRKGPKIYVGEYAVTQGNGSGSLRGALAEAAFMTGMERNSDIVAMSSYAPLFANVHNKAWNPDLIYFDSSRVVATPSYHVQKLFSINRAHRVLPSRLENVPRNRKPFPSGGFGVGTWNTQAEFKDFRVTQDGKSIFDSKDGSALVRESGNWALRDGGLTQTGNASFARVYGGINSLRNYTFELKAKKVSGAEGFLITVGRRSNGDYVWWNLGGWGNTQHALEIAISGGKTILGQRPGRIETNRWYNIRVEYFEDRVRGFLDDKILLDQQLIEPISLHGVSGIDKTGSTVILKLVNVSDQAHDVQVDLAKTKWRRVKGSAEVLTGNNPDENTLDRPHLVRPKKIGFAARPTKFSYRISPRSLCILRLNEAK